MRKLSNRRMWSDGLLGLMPNPATRVDLTPLAQPRPATGTNPPPGSPSRPTTATDGRGK